MVKKDTKYKYELKANYIISDQYCYGVMLSNNLIFSNFLFCFSMNKLIVRSKQSPLKIFENKVEIVNSLNYILPIVK